MIALCYHLATASANTSYCTKVAKLRQWQSERVHLCDIGRLRVKAKYTLEEIEARKKK